MAASLKVGGYQVYWWTRWQSSL